MSNSILIKGGSILGGDIKDLLIRDGRIVEISPSITTSTDEVIDAQGCILMPGFVDLHTHLREPGRENSETIATGSLAAARGGYVAVSAMANTLPVADTAAIVEQVSAIGKRVGLVDVFPIGAVTKGLEGHELADLASMAHSGAQVRVFSDDGNCVSDPLLMRRALEYVKQFDGVIAQHAQDPRLTEGSQMNEGVIASTLGLKGWPAVAEESIIARDILLANMVGSRLHICHVTTRGGVEIIRWAKAQGMKVTSEVTPHHLLLTDELAESYDPIYKVNPPLRTQSDVEALREGLADGTIDIIGTDHAPHPVESKECEWQSAAFGMVGLETAFPILYSTLIATGKITWERAAQVMSIAPAAIAGYSGHGQEIREGAPAHIAVINPAGTLVVDRAQLASKSKNTPFHGMEFQGTVVATVFNGHLTHKVGVRSEKDE
ncbi:PyrC Dihydroorotase and related cyclic amidohydrolases [Candidatus Nanopelagicaceae bacterium]